MDNQFERLKRQYKDIPIPDQLDFIVNQSIKQAVKSRKRKSASRRRLTGIAAAVVIFVAGINTNPNFAKAMSEVPVIGQLVKVLTIKEFKVEEPTAKATLQVPAITILDNKSLETALNDKYMEEAKKLYQDFTTEMDRLKQNGGGQLGVNSGYTVKTDNDQILAIGRYVVNTVNSSSTTFQYDTIDKKNQLLITLPSLFKDDRYISIISENIKVQMKQQMKDDPKKAYWVEGVPNQTNTYFKAIAQNQNFYINNDGKLVISFNKYDVAPGYMGVVEFVIPTGTLADVLVSHAYLK
ncbi:DUF3298 and DUF4163 domain-containing protein [Paenibacillus mesophilus]|uniref:RsiV family protein n=1 Tax=Paenibacillus mesophilus TaxID=2582849 RepID=UPI00110ED418|nr:RsiV family protein [Paenibacillus mesophilus]TMV43311.1 DUF3298 and DUF4163 domain-containing protein [Paenibacillus mesophilus]